MPKELLSEEEFRRLYDFFAQIRIEEDILSEDEDRAAVRVTYCYGDRRFVAEPLYYSKDMVKVADGQPIERKVLDVKEHAWPTGNRNHDYNTDLIIDYLVNHLVGASDDEKSIFRQLLVELRYQVDHVAFGKGRPVKYGRNLMNNNHWHDLVRLVQRCLVSPEEVENTVKVRSKALKDPLFARLIYRWDRTDKEKRHCFHGDYEMVRSLLEAAKKYRPRQKQRQRIDHITQLLKRHKQIILTGPPGTGKTWLAKRVAANLLGIDLEEVDKEEEQVADSRFAEARFRDSKDGGAWAIVQFHPNYNYEDFVRGIRVETAEEKVAYRPEHRILSLMVKKAIEHPNDKFLLIVDEINRANLPAVLGELIYALEYRGSPVLTPYEVDGSRELVIPKNFFIIGTMNSADRSVGHVDYAVRRRFLFVKCQPLKDVVEQVNAEEVRRIAVTLFEAVERLFQREEGFLARDFHKDDVQVGHTYFIAKESEGEDLREVLFEKFAYQVYPLLREYYKDGVFQSEGSSGVEIKLDGVDGRESLSISISSEESVEDILEKLRAYFGPQQGQIPQNAPPTDEVNPPSDVQSEERK